MQIRIAGVILLLLAVTLPTALIDAAVLLSLKTCRMISTVETGICTRATDARTAQEYEHSSCSRTKGTRFDWWTASTEWPAHISGIQVTRDRDCSADETFSRVAAAVDGHECALETSASNSSALFFNCDRIGQTVTIRGQPYDDLPLCEVLVFGSLSSRPASQVQLKLGRCHQSSTLGAASCNRAIDGNTNQEPRNGTCSHTLDGRLDWWTASTEWTAHIREIRIYNRLECCAERRPSNLVITVDGHECGSYNYSTEFSVMTFQCHRVGQSVTIKSLLNDPLSLCEVQAFGEFINHTANQDQPLGLRSCEQSSTLETGICNKAIDGNTNQDFESGSCSQTADYQQNWWTARTGQLARIKEVRIFNRLDCCTDRLSNFVISVDGRQCAAYKFPTAFSVMTFGCDRIGQTLMIRSLLNDSLSLCEVQAFGQLINCSDASSFANSSEYCFESGKLLLFTISAGSGYEALGEYRNISSKHTDIGNGLPLIYRSQLLNDLPSAIWRLKASRIVAEMRLKAKMVAQATFNVSDSDAVDSENWFTARRLVLSSPYSLDKAEYYQYFAIAGFEETRSNPHRRTFYIQFKHSGCHADIGFMAVGETPTDHCPWVSNGMTHGMAPALIYSTQKAAYNSSVRYADQFIIYISLPSGH